MTERTEAGLVIGRLSQEPACFLYGGPVKLMLIAMKRRDSVTLQVDDSRGHSSVVFIGTQKENSLIYWLMINRGKGL